MIWMKMSTQLLFFVGALICICYGMDANAPLELLDRRIYDELSEPTETLGRGELLLKEMIAYYCNLLDVFNFLKWKDNKGMEMISDMEKDGGPKVPTMEIDENAIKTAYKWQEKDFEVLTTMLGSIKSLWHKCTDRVYRFSSSLLSPHREELLTP